MRTSARNQFVGQVTALQLGAVNDEVTVKLDEGLEITAIVTHASAVSLGLLPGKTAYALVKASSVIVMVGVSGDQVSARNCVEGTVSSIIDGAVNSEVVITAGKVEVVAIVTKQSVGRLKLAVGGPATAMFKASSVIVGVDD